MEHLYLPNLYEKNSLKANYERKRAKNNNKKEYKKEIEKQSQASWLTLLCFSETWKFMTLSRYARCIYRNICCI